MNNIGTIVELSEFEKKLSHAIAKVRFESNRKAGVTNAKRGSQSNAQTDLEGVGSELAFCKLFNTYPTNTFTTTPRSSQKGEDIEGDSILKDKLVDVKSTTYQTGELIAAPWKGKNGVDCYALMTGNFPRYVFRGFMTAKKLLDEKKLGDLGRGPIYIAQQNELVEFEQLEW